MERNARSKLNTQIYEEACGWLVDFRGGEVNAATRRQFDLWMRKSPEHLAAYLEIAAIWNEGPALDPEQKWDAETLIARAASDADNIIALSPRPRADHRVRLQSFRRLTIAGSIAVLTVIAGTVVWSAFVRAPTYTTAVGEQRSIALADGSTIELNSRTKIRVRYTAHERAIELLAGQALFQVAKDSARPFIVSSDMTRVHAVGTQFDVYKKPSGTVVTVVEGRVAILANSGRPDTRTNGIATATSGKSSIPENPRTGDPDSVTPQSLLNAPLVYLSAGEQLTVTRQLVRKTLHPNVVRATAWTQRQLVFESASLAEVAEEFNRYNERQLVIEDAALYDFHISGVFSSTDPASLIRFLRERPGVKIIETPAEIRVERISS